jgi:hypothetical protein
MLRKPWVIILITFAYCQHDFTKSTPHPRRYHPVPSCVTRLAQEPDRPLLAVGWAQVARHPVVQLCARHPAPLAERFPTFFEYTREDQIWMHRLVQVRPTPALDAKPWVLDLTAGAEQFPD